MLKAMRKNLKTLSITLWLVIASFILFIFIDWGAGRYLGVSREDVVVTVGDEYIDVKTFEDALTFQLMNISKRNPNARLTRGAIERFGVPQAVLSQLVRDAVIREKAHDLNLTVTDQEVADYIMTMPAFQRNGKFVGKEEYHRILAYNGIPVERFEESIRNFLYQQKLYNVITAGIVVGEDEVKEAFRRQNEVVELEYVYVNFDDIEVKEPTEQEIRAHFSANKNKYIIPEKRKAKYVVLNQRDFEGKVSVTFDKIKKYYRDNIDMFTEPERFHIFKIYVKKENRSKLEKALEELKAGKSFEEVAKKYSEGIKAQSGGDWGELTASQLQDVELQWVRTAREGSFSPILELPGGYEIIKLAKRIPQHERPLEEVRTSIERVLKAQEAQRLMVETAKELSKKAKDEKDLEKVAKEMGFEVKVSDYLEPGDTLPEDPLGSLSRVVFQLEKRDVSDPILLFNGVGVAQLIEIKPPRPAKYEEVAEKIKEELKIARKQKKALEIIENFKMGKELPSIAVHKKESFNYGKALGNIKPSEYLDSLIMRAPIGKWSEPVRIERGVFCFRVLKRSGVDAEQYAKKKAEIKSKLLEEKRNRFFQSYLTNLMREMKVRINPDVYNKVKDMVLSRF